jgi:signal transduction histidine kinase
VAATGKIPVTAEDLQTDPRWDGTPAQTQLLASGLRSAWSTPFFSSGGTVLGTLCIYRRTPARPEADHHGIVERMARIASIAIERLRAEDELRRRQYLLETAERISETGSFSWDMNNNKLVWSKQMYRIHELDENLEPVYPNLLATVHPDDAQRIYEDTVRAFNGEASAEGGYRLIMPDGRIKYLRTAFQVVNHDDGRRESVGVAQDVTRRRLAEDALDKVRSELAHVTRVTSLGELAASIAHEVNQPLSGIITNASACLRMLTAGHTDLDRAIKAVERIIRDGNRASEVIKRLRNLFRRQDFSAEPFDLNEAAQEVIAICSHDLQRRRIALSVDLDPKLPSLVGDRIQLQQVILNLVLNAADAIGASDRQPRQIAIETAQSAPGIAQLTVRDTGCGIAPDDLNKIFEAFYTTKPNGMGIGLSVSKSILERHDGKLWACANEGPGSAFSFSLPCAPRGRGEAHQEAQRIDEVQDESNIQSRWRHRPKRGPVRDDTATVFRGAVPGGGAQRRSHCDRPQARGGILAGSGRCLGATRGRDGQQTGQ